MRNSERDYKRCEQCLAKRIQPGKIRTRWCDLYLDECCTCQKSCKKEHFPTQKIVILADGGVDGPIYYDCTYGLKDICIKSDVFLTEDIKEFLSRSRAADYRFIDFGELAPLASMGRVYDSYRLLQNYMQDNPSVIFHFVLTMGWEYYKQYDIWELPNAERFGLTNSHWEITELVRLKLISE